MPRPHVQNGLDLRALGEAIEARRERRDLGVRELAREAGIDASNLSKYERGLMGPSLANFLALARALRADPRTLLRAAGWR